MRTNSRISLGHTLQATCGTLPSNENELLTRHLAMRTNSLLTRQLSNKYKLPTHTLQARCGTFTLLQFQFLIPNFQPISPFPKVRKQEFVLIARQCTARCSQRVAQRHSGVRPHWRITPNKILLLYIRYKHLLFAEPHVASNVRYIAFPLRTNSLLTPSKVRYISFQRNL